MQAPVLESGYLKLEVRNIIFCAIGVTEFRSGDGPSKRLKTDTLHEQRYSGGKSVSEPISRRSSVSRSVEAVSPPTPSIGKRKRVMECVELPTYRDVLARERRKASPRWAGPSLSPETSYDDHSSWETGLDDDDVKQLQQELGYPSGPGTCHPAVLHTDLNSLISTVTSDSESSPMGTQSSIGACFFGWSKSTWSLTAS